MGNVAELLIGNTAAPVSAAPGKVLEVSMPPVNLPKADTFGAQIVIPPETGDNITPGF